ncbi:cation acetate symporter [Streptomyces longwoodensis]|uniref:sodium/solute symporter n=1 Tax=Streptomyces longwoodensis TaxID=68231 RepID=UPI0033E28FDB
MTPPSEVAMTTGSTLVQAAPLTAFLLIICVTLLLCLLLGVTSDGVEDLYVAGQSVRPWANALALTGDLVSVLILLSTVGLVAASGYDGIVAGVSTAVALGVLLVLARPLRTTGRFTLGDTLAARFSGGGVRVAATVVTLGCSLPLAIVQLTSAGEATAALIGVDEAGAAQICTIFIGAMMVCAAALTGMRGNTMLQAIKTVVVFGWMGLLVLLVMARAGWSPDVLLTGAADHSVAPHGYYAPGVRLAAGLTGRLNLVSLQISIILGLAVVPHMVMRVKAAESGTSARRSVFLAIVMAVPFCLMSVILGLGASAYGGRPAGGGFAVQSAGPLLMLAQAMGAQWGGGLVVALTVSAVFLTSLTVVAALTLSSSSALVHDLYAQRRQRGNVSAEAEVRAMSWVTPALGALAVVLSVAAQAWNIQFMAQFAVTTAASTVLPALVYALFWTRCTRAGILWCIYVGLGTSVVFLVFGTSVSGAPGALFPTSDFAWFPLQSSGLVSVPAAFVAGWVASRRTSRGTTAGQWGAASAVMPSAHADGTTTRRA